MANNLVVNPRRFYYGNPPKLLMEFIPDQKSEDRYNAEPYHIQLYVYEWTIDNYSMINWISGTIVSPVFRVGPFGNMEMKLFLCQNDESLKIEVQLSREARLTDEMLIKKANCLLSSKICKNIVNLEFPDFTGNFLQYSRSLLYEVKYVNTSVIYTWKTEESESRFVNNDSFTVRVKLSIRYYNDGPEVDESSGSDEKVMQDMKKLFHDRSSCFPDVVIKVGGQFILAHKSILYSQCPYFAEMAGPDINTKEEQKISSFNVPANISNALKENYETLHIPNENADVFLSVLHFIYCGQMYATDSVSDFAVYEFAKKHGVRELSMLMEPSEVKIRSEPKVEKITYIWHVKDFTKLCDSRISHNVSPDFETTNGVTISWNIVLDICFDSHFIKLYLKKNSGCGSSVQTAFKLSICKENGLVHAKKEFKRLFVNDSSSTSEADSLPCSLMFPCRGITPYLLFNGILTVSCDLVVSNGTILSKTKHVRTGGYTYIELKYWIKNFRDLLENGNFSDAALVVDDEEFKIHKSILSARSPVFAKMFESDMKEKQTGFVRIEDISSTVMKEALLYIYTGETNLTMINAAELYRTADKYEIMDLKTRCYEFIMDNMDAENSPEILVLADLYNEQKMKNNAKDLICRNASQVLLSPSGIEFITNHTSLAQDIFETLSKYYSTPPVQNRSSPQDAVSSYGRLGPFVSPPSDEHRKRLSRPHVFHQDN